MAGTIELQGVTPMVDGHYIAVVRHDAAADDFYFYGVLQVRRRATLPGEDGPAHDDGPKADGAETDHKLGFDLWCRFKTVISLTVNIHAPSVLGRLLLEMRGGQETRGISPTKFVSRSYVK